MFFNNIFQSLLTFVLFVILAIIVFSIPKKEYFKVFKLIYSSFLFVSFLGILIAFIVGLMYNKNPDFMKEDFLKLTSFMLLMGMPFYVLGMKSIYRNTLFRIYNISAFVYTFLVAFSSIFSENIGDNVSIYPGNLFGASTVNLTIISTWLFYSFAIFKITKQKKYLLWAMICYVNVVISLAKWNFFSILIFPILFLYSIYTDSSITTFKKYVYVFFSSTLLVLFVLNIDNVLNPIVNLKGFENFETFLKVRVLGDPDNVANLSSTLDVSSELSFKDGARFAMWGDLLDRFYESPIFGIGLGSRALDYTGLYAEDHNIFITHLTRYGFLLFLFWFSLMFILIRHLLNYNLNLKNNSLYFLIFLCIYLNFFFQGSVGNIWGQLPVIISLSFAVGFYLSRFNGSMYSNT